jgi:oligopeptide transport system ATP-binding protein
MNLLEVSSLSVTYQTRRGRVQAVNDVSFELERGRCLGIVGESGSGKTQTCLAIAGLLSADAAVSGSVRFEGRELVGASRRTLNELRGKRIAMVFQDPMTALTPHLTVGSQLCEVLKVHEGMHGAAARRRALDIMERVRIADPERRFDMYPFELSGGMRQRVMIALALILRPALVLADEPTTALDVTVQAEVISTFRAVIEHTGTSLLLVTHDLGVVAGLCDSVMVMYAGRTVEQAPVNEIFASSAHPYTRALLECLPRADRPRGSRMMSIAGQPPDLADLPAGCAFAPRCMHSEEVCMQRSPVLESSGPQRAVACLRAASVS